MNTEALLPFLQTILSFMNICVLGYALFKFLNKPHSNLETRVSTLETNHQELKTTNALEHKEFKESLQDLRSRRIPRRSRQE
jgi:hypothetical protein